VLVIGVYFSDWVSDTLRQAQDKLSQCVCLPANLCGGRNGLRNAWFRDTLLVGKWTVSFLKKEIFLFIPGEVARRNSESVSILILGFLPHSFIPSSYFDFPGKG